MISISCCLPSKNVVQRCLKGKQATSTMAAVSAVHRELFIKDNGFSQDFHHTSAPPHRQVIKSFALENDHGHFCTNILRGPELGRFILQAKTFKLSIIINQCLIQIVGLKYIVRIIQSEKHYARTQTANFLIYFENYKHLLYAPAQNWKLWR